MVILRTNWTIRASTGRRILLGPFVGKVTGNPWDFSGCAAALTFGSQQGTQPPSLVLSQVPGPSGGVRLNANGNLGYVLVDVTPIGAAVLLAVSNLQDMQLYVSPLGGEPIAIVVGMAAIEPGW